MQPGFHGTDGCTGKLLNFFEFIALCIVQKYDDSVFVAELGQRFVEPL